MRLIDADALKEVFEEHEDRRGDLDCDWRILIDNAPECPFCHRLFDIGDNYCGFCGADMRGDEE